MLVRALPLLLVPLAAAFALWLLRYFARVSGWAALSEQYQASKGPSSRPVRRVAFRMGEVVDSATRLIPEEAGLYLRAPVLFRFTHPTLLIPWSRVRRLGDYEQGWWRFRKAVVVLDVAGLTELHLPASVYAMLRSRIEGVEVPTPAA